MNIFKSKISESQKALEKLQVEFNLANEAFETLQKEYNTLKEESANLKEELTQLKVENVELETEVETKSEEIEQVTQEIAETSKGILEVEAVASIKAMEILASTGSEPLEILEQEEEFDVVSEFKKLKGKDLQEFYKKHSTEIKKALKK
jgi:uncharacterized phage infection (PIP) family protein YhgE